MPACFTRNSGHTIRAAVLAAMALLAAAGLPAQTLGAIDFPNSGAPAAQPKFIEGVKDLHSFEFDEAAEAFRAAQRIDPAFAMAYWGEALSYNHPLWGQLDLAASRKALEKLSPTPEGRASSAPTAREKAFLAAAGRLFYAPGDKLARDNAYCDALARMHDQWPNDHEIAIFYAVSLLGTVRPVDKGFRRQALAASLALQVYRENPSHPGAAHFIIHSFDDPDHAILALPAARAYARIAPSAPHALHMPSHIFVQLGMWEDAVTSNVAAYKAATNLIARTHRPEGREDFHTLSWLEYANLMLGKFGDALHNVELARQAVERNPDNPAIAEQYRTMRARYILETRQWEKLPIDVPSAGSSAPPSMAGMPGMGGRYTDQATWVFIAGLSAAKLGDPETAARAVAKLGAMRQGVEKSPDAYAAKPLAVMETELAAAEQSARGRKDEAVRLAKQAVEIEAAMAAPSGPPDPIQPALEFYAETLVEAGNRREAALAFRQQLLRTPQRKPSVEGLAQSLAEGDAISSPAAR